MYNTYIFRPILGTLSVFNFERVYLKSKFSRLRPCGLQGLNYHCAEKKIDVGEYMLLKSMKAIQICTLTHMLLKSMKVILICTLTQEINNRAERKPTCV